jgi:hypothetical protein
MEIGTQSPSTYIITGGFKISIAGSLKFAAVIGDNV